MTKLPQKTNSAKDSIETEFSQVRLGDFTEVIHIPGRYLNDHCLVQKDGVWHFFGIVGKSRHPPDAPVSETCLAHATSADLFTWQVHPDVMHMTGEWPEEWLLAAPFVIGRDGLFYMFYFGCCKRDHAQWICLATSADLFAWERYPGNPVVAPSLSWAKWPGYTKSPGMSGSCRDPHVILLADGRYVMYYTVDLPDQGPDRMVGIAVAVSRDLKHWQDYGPVYRQKEWTVPGKKAGVRSSESACVIARDGEYWLFFTNGFWTNFMVSNDPFNFTDKPVRRLGFSHAAEIFQGNGRWWITHCSSDPDDYAYFPTNRTRGLFISELSWPAGGVPHLK